MPPVVRHLADRLDGLGWVTDLLVAGSLATGDYVPGVSDLDLVALTTGPVGPDRQGKAVVVAEPGLKPPVGSDRTAADLRHRVSAVHQGADREITLNR